MPSSNQPAPTSQGPKYLQQEVVEQKRTAVPNYGTTRDGYSKRSGAPTGTMVRLASEKTWRRVMVSNAGTAFVRVKGEPLIVRLSDGTVQP